MDVTLSDSTTNLLFFGDYFKALSILETSTLRCIMAAEEVALIEGFKYYSPSELRDACQDILNNDMDHYAHVRNRIVSFLHMWDAVTAEKLKCDAAGHQPESRRWLQAFLSCAILVSERVKPGLVGPFIFSSPTGKHVTLHNDGDSGSLDRPLGNLPAASEEHSLLAEENFQENQSNYSSSSLHGEDADKPTGHALNPVHVKCEDGDDELMEMK
ncbi:hypothetical protein GQ53DRAFT_744649 [Thozetella sp. PMI_491]|nr:hypothetical protein GQ53DRAFT_744649 [Thozetella sp. PMI_491]